jgi:hypothetical protein
MTAPFNNPAPQRAILALVLPTHKRYFAPGWLQLLASTGTRVLAPCPVSRFPYPESPFVIEGKAHAHEGSAWPAGSTTKQGAKLIELFIKTYIILLEIVFLHLDKLIRILYYNMVMN